VSRFSTTGGAILVSFLVAACSGSSPSAEQSAGSEPSAGVSLPASSAASQGALPSLAAGSGSLEGIVPETVAGITINYQFATGQGVLGSEGVTPEVQDFLNSSHADINDVTMAIGIGIDQANGTAVSIFALRVAGADEGALRDQFKQVMTENGSDTLTEQTVGGKSVFAIADSSGDVTTWMYVHSDVVFVVGASSADLAAQALAALP
jgi:hypothetical protein